MKSSHLVSVLSIALFIGSICLWKPISVSGEEVKPLETSSQTAVTKPISVAVTASETEDPTLPSCCRPVKASATSAVSSAAIVGASGGGGNTASSTDSGTVGNQSVIKDRPIVQPGIEEKLGKILPLDLSFTDENGVSKPLKELITRPTILAFVFYRCPVVCNLVQGSVADAIGKISKKPGEEYNVISLSIDEFDTTVTAKNKKAEIFNTLDGKFPDPAWKFLFGNKENIQSITQAAGFYFDRVKGAIVHPAALIFLTSEGKIVRYLHGTQFLPMNVNLALTEAAEGRVGLAVKSVVSFCFSYDPAGKKYVLNVMRISGLVILIFVGTFAFFLLRGKDPDVRK